MLLSALPLWLQFFFVICSFRGVTAYPIDVFKLYFGQGDLQDRLRTGIAVVINGLRGLPGSKCTC